MKDQDKFESEDQVYKTDHSYDGIEELDYPLPKWWLAILYLSILFAIGYFGYYVLGSGPSLKEEYDVSLAANQAQLVSKTAKVWPDDAKLASLEKDNAAISTGKGVFSTRCASCHGPDGGGLIGPNLADNHWIHGKGDLKGIARVIYDGVGDKGMPAWGPMLKDDELYGIVVYVKSLKGTKPQNPKAPQGTEVKE